MGNKSKGITSFFKISSTYWLGIICYIKCLLTVSTTPYIGQKVQCRGFGWNLGQKHSDAAAIIVRKAQILKYVKQRVD